MTTIIKNGHTTLVLWSCIKKWRLFIRACTFYVFENKERPFIASDSNADVKQNTYFQTEKNHCI